MKVWLDPVEQVHDDENFIVAVLVRITQACDKAGLRLLELDELTHDFSRLPAMRRVSAFQDAYQHAAEKVAAERLAVNLPGRLKSALAAIELHFGYGIEWCLPFIDHDLHFVDQTKAIAKLNKFPNLTCYVVLADAEGYLASNWRGRNNVVVLADHTLAIMAPELGFPQWMGKSPPIADSYSESYPSHESYDSSSYDGNIQPTSVDFADVTPKPKKKKKKYRTIDEN